MWPASSPLTIWWQSTAKTTFMRCSVRRAVRGCRPSWSFGVCLGLWTTRPNSDAIQTLYTLTTSSKCGPLPGWLPRSESTPGASSRATTITRISDTVSTAWQVAGFPTGWSNLEIGSKLGALRGSSTNCPTGVTRNGPGRVCTSFRPRCVARGATSRPPWTSYSISSTIQAKKKKQQQKA